MHSIASAPGKMMLLGEFAVLEDAPAVVIAINRRAVVRVTSAEENPRAKNKVSVPELCPREISFEIDEQRQVSWLRTDALIRKKLALLGQVIAEFHTGKAVHISTDTSAFFRDGKKMGFGSSAALTVAAATALQGATPELATLVETHRAAQNGRGSGFDIAAAIEGGVINFRSQPLQAQPVSLPADLYLCGVWTGQSASTSSLLRELDAADNRSQAIDELCKEAEQAIGGLAGDAASWVAAVARYSTALQRFAAQTSLPVFAGGHSAVAEIAKNSDIAYKPSGAGGGDIGVAASTDKAALESFGRLLRASGVSVFDLEIAGQGVRMDS
ncbi:MAG: hypothetical protein KJO35_04620 [Gammaproteobacteria bacterium]|nr:hypothetical protein [Gammaproteobacteria bacterium]